MTLDQAIERIEKEVLIAKRRMEIEHFTDERNIYELTLAIDYALNPPKQKGRKEPKNENNN